ncbi:MAG: hypothetical protein WCY82_08815 [Desulfotomaculaceae bacterium]
MASVALAYRPGVPPAGADYGRGRDHHIVHTWPYSGTPGFYRAGARFFFCPYCLLFVVGERVIMFKKLPQPDGRAHAKRAGGRSRGPRHRGGNAA